MTKIRKPVSKETFVIASKVVDKPLKVINWYLFMHYYECNTYSLCIKTFRI